MKNRILTVLWLVLMMPGLVRAEMKVLFIGNSFTFGGTASVPTIFDRLAQAGGHGDPTVVMRAMGGMDFQFFAGDATTESVINSQPRDFVVLQNFSIEPTHFVDSRHSIANHFRYGQALYEKVMANNQQTHVVLYETWSRAAAHPYITGVSGPTSFASTAEMQGELRTNYRALADLLNRTHLGYPLVHVAPIGDAWENAGGLREASDPLFVDLHADDNYHGDDDGYYLSAAVLYSQIFGESPSGLSSNPLIESLNLKTDVSATHLEAVAWETVKSVPEPEISLLLVAEGCIMVSGRGLRRLLHFCAG